MGRRDKDQNPNNERIPAMSTNKKPVDHYQVLGLERNANADQIKKAYKKVAMKWHPDKNPDNEEEATKQFELVGEAYEILSNPLKKADYDKNGNTQTQKNFDDDTESSFDNEVRKKRAFATFKKFFGSNFFGKVSKAVTSLLSPNKKTNKPKRKQKTPQDDTISSSTASQQAKDQTNIKTAPKQQPHQLASLDKLILGIAAGDQTAYDALRTKLKWSKYGHIDKKRFDKLSRALDSNINSANIFNFLSHFSRFQIQELEQVTEIYTHTLLNHSFINIFLSNKTQYNPEKLALYALALAAIDQTELAQKIIDKKLNGILHTQEAPTDFLQTVLQNSTPTEASITLVVERILQGEHTLHSDALEKTDPDEYLQRLEFAWPLLENCSDSYKKLIMTDLDKIAEVPFFSGVSNQQQKFLQAISKINPQANIYPVLQTMFSNVATILKNIDSVTSYIKSGCSDWVNDHQSAQITMSYLRTQLVDRTNIAADQEKLAIANVLTSTMNLYNFGIDKNNSTLKNSARSIMEATHQFLQRPTNERVNTADEYLDKCNTAIKKCAPQIQKLHRAPIIANLFVALVTLVIPYLIALVYNHHKTGRWGFFAQNQDKHIQPISGHTQQMSQFLTAIG